MFSRLAGKIEDAVFIEFSEKLYINQLHSAYIEDVCLSCSLKGSRRKSFIFLSHARIAEHATDLLCLLLYCRKIFRLPVLLVNLKLMPKVFSLLVLIRQTHFAETLSHRHLIEAGK